MINDFLSQQFSSSICIEYCRGSAEHHKYALVEQSKCSCATELSATFDQRWEPLPDDADAVKKPLDQCGLSGSHTMIGSDANNVVAMYNIEYSRQYHGSKLAPTTCISHEHNLFYSRYGINILTFQSEIGRPILRADCNYEHPHLCLHPLIHNIASTR